MLYSLCEQCMHTHTGYARPHTGSAVGALALDALVIWIVGAVVDIGTFSILARVCCVLLCIC